MFSRHKKSPDGMQYICKPCLAEWRKNPFSRDIATPPPANAVPGKLIGIPKETYQPAKDNTYYRNDGNKHIKSKGILC